MAWASEGQSEPTTAGLLKREIPWDTYLTARLISDRDLQMIRRYDKRERNQQREQLHQVLGPPCQPTAMYEHC